jgi:hypothetical protein
MLPSQDFHCILTGSFESYACSSSDEFHGAVAQWPRFIRNLHMGQSGCSRLSMAWLCLTIQLYHNFTPLNPGHMFCPHPAPSFPFAPSIWFQALTSLWSLLLHTALWPPASHVHLLSSKHYCLWVASFLSVWISLPTPTTHTPLVSMLADMC